MALPADGEPAAVDAPDEAAPALAPAPAPAPPTPPAELLTAPAWIFRYAPPADARDARRRGAGPGHHSWDAPPRVATWTLRHRDGRALVEVESGQGTARYLGTATEGASLAIDVASPTATMKLDCRPASRPIGATCDARRPAALDVLDCYHPDFAAPMTFARAPGVVFDAACNAYRRLP